MKSEEIIPKHEGWNGQLTWSRRHESGLFALKVAVHAEGRASDYSPPRIWNSYLLGGDTCRWYRDGKPDMHVVKCPLTDLVWKEGEDFFDDLAWNGGVTSFRLKEEHSKRFGSIRSWVAGDDYAHLWDGEEQRWDYYNFPYVKGNIEQIAHEFKTKLERLGIKKEKPNE